MEVAERTTEAEVDPFVLGLAYHEVYIYGAAWQYALYGGAAVAGLTAWALVHHVRTLESIGLFAGIWIASALAGATVGGWHAGQTGHLMRRYPFYFAFLAVYHTRNYGERRWWMSSPAMTERPLRVLMAMYHFPRTERERKCGISAEPAATARRLHRRRYFIELFVGLIVLVGWIAFCVAAPWWIGVEGWALSLRALIFLLPFWGGCVAYVRVWSTAGRPAVAHPERWRQADALVRDAGWKYAWHSGWWGGELFVPSAPSTHWLFR